MDIEFEVGGGSYLLVPKLRVLGCQSVNSNKAQTVLKQQSRHHNKVQRAKLTALGGLMPTELNELLHIEALKSCSNERCHGR